MGSVILDVPLTQRPFVSAICGKGRWGEVVLLGPFCSSLVPPEDWRTTGGASSACWV